MFRIAALNETCGSEEDPENIKLTKTKEAKEAEAFAVYNKALLYQQKGHSVHAEKLLKNLLVEHPLLQEASGLVEDEKQSSNENHRGLQLLYLVHKNMASIYLHRNELESAIKSYIEAVRIDPSEVTVWFKMGQISLKLDKFALAKISFQQALECNSKHWPSLDQAITVTFALGDYLMCLEYISTALENDSSYPKGLALRKQILTEQPSLEDMTAQFFENCDPEIYRVHVTKEERKQFVNEATKIRSKARQLANDFHEEQNKPVAFLEPLTPFTWKNMGDQLIKLYDFATNNDSPKSLGQEVDLRDYFFLDPTLFLGQDENDAVNNVSAPSKEREKTKSPTKHLSRLESGVLQSVTSSTRSANDSAFQRASKQQNLQSTAVIDVLGMQGGAKESALLKRLQGQMLIQSSPDKLQLQTSAETESFSSENNAQREEAMDVSEAVKLSDENVADGNNDEDDNIEDIDMPLLDTVDLDINLTDIQKIDLKPEFLLKADEDELSNLADVKSLENVLSSVIDMECEQQEQEQKNNSENNIEDIFKSKKEEYNINMDANDDKLSLAIVESSSLVDTEKPQNSETEANILPMQKKLPEKEDKAEDLSNASIADLPQSCSQDKTSLQPTESPKGIYNETKATGDNPKDSGSITATTSSAKGSSEIDTTSSAMVATVSKLPSLNLAQSDFLPQYTLMPLQVTHSVPSKLESPTQTMDDDVSVRQEDDTTVVSVSLPSSQLERVLTDVPDELSLIQGNNTISEIDLSSESKHSLSALRDDTALSDNTLTANTKNSSEMDVSDMENTLIPSLTDAVPLSSPKLVDTPVNKEITLERDRQNVEIKSKEMEYPAVADTKYPLPSQHDADGIEMKQDKTEELIPAPVFSEHLPAAAVLSSPKQLSKDHYNISSLTSTSPQSQSDSQSEIKATPSSTGDTLSSTSVVSPTGVASQMKAMPPLATGVSPRDIHQTLLESQQGLSEILATGSPKESQPITTVSSKDIHITTASLKDQPITTSSPKNTQSITTVSPKGSSETRAISLAMGSSSSPKNTSTERSHPSDYHSPRHSSLITKGLLLSPRKGTGNLIDDVIRSELNLGTKPIPPSPTATAAPHSSLFVNPDIYKQQISFCQEQDSVKSSNMSSTSSPSSVSLHYPGIPPSYSSHNKQSPQKLIMSPPPSSPVSKVQKASSPGHVSPGMSAPISNLHQQQYSSSLDLFSNPLHNLPSSGSDIHHTLQKELALLNIPMHYLNSISTLEAEALLKAAASSPSSSSSAASSEQRRTDPMRDLIFKQQQESSLNFPSIHNLPPHRQLSRSLSSPGYFSGRDPFQRQDLLLTQLTQQHPLLSPPISTSVTHGPSTGIGLLSSSSYPLSAPLIPGLNPSHCTNPSTQPLHHPIPTPYPLLSHHQDSSYTTTTPFPNLYPPLSPRSKYPLIPSTSPSYLRSRFPPSSLPPYDTTSLYLQSYLHHHHHLLHPHLPPNWLGSPSSISTSNPSEFEIPPYQSSLPLPPRKALFTSSGGSSSSNTTGQSYHRSLLAESLLAPPPAKSKRLSASHRSVSHSGEQLPRSSYQDQFQRMIEQMLDASPPTSVSQATTKMAAGSSTSQASPRENVKSVTAKSKNRGSASGITTARQQQQQQPQQQSQRGAKRRLEELGTTEWAEVFRGGRSTRSRSSRGKKEEPVMDIQKLLLTYFPPSLLELSEVKDTFLGNDDSRESSEAADKMKSVVDLSKISSIADGETDDVKAFLKKCLKGNGILDLIFKYLLHLAGRVDCLWTEDLTQTFMHVYKRLRKHITAPSVFDCFEGFTPDSLDKYTQVMLAYCELVLDTVRISHASKTALMSPSAGGCGMVTESESCDVSEQVGEFYNEDVTFLSAITRCEDVIGLNHLNYSVRIYWLKARYHQLCSETLDAIDCFQMVSEYIGDIKEETSKEMILPNLKEDRVISQQSVEAQVDSLKRSKSLENTKSLFDKGDYSLVVDSLLQTYDKKSVRQSKERPSQLLLLQESLDRLGRKEDNLKWAEIAIHEALTQFTSIRDQPLKQSWSNTLVSLFFSVDRLLSENMEIVDTLGSDHLGRLSHNTVSVIKSIIDVGRSTPSEMPINSLLPWILLYRILKHEESKMEYKEKGLEEDDKTNTEEGEKDDDNDSDDDDDDDDHDEESQLKPSIKMLIQAHEQLGRHSWCTKEDGVLLFFLMEELKPLIEDLEDEDDKQTCVYAYDQCLFCLYNHPSKKGKARHLQDHQAKPITLTWERAMPVFQYFTKSMMPEFDSKKTSSITVDVEHLLRRIYILVPSRISPNSFQEAVTSYIDGTTSDIVVPATLQQSLSSAASAEEKAVESRLYYLLADFYLKNGEVKKSVKLYQLDLLVNPGRMDSWAGLALAKMSHIQQDLNSTDLRIDAPAPKKWDGAMRCFQRAVDCDQRSRKLWVEYGLLAYQLHSHASRQAKMFATSNTHREFVQVAQERCQRYLKSAFTSFSHAIDCNCGDDGTKDDWLLHYMLGKVAEKQTPHKPAIILDHYAKAAECLHKERALYPEKIVFATTPPHLALEALEVFYRVHTAILLLVMHDRIANQDLPAVYTASVRTLTGKFARCEKHKPSSDTDREERSSSTNTVSGQNQTTITTAASKGKKSTQPKSAVSDHSYSKAGKISVSAQSSPEKRNTINETKHQKDENKPDEKSNQVFESSKDFSKDKDSDVFSSQEETKSENKEVQEKIDESVNEMESDYTVVEVSESPFSDSKGFGKENISKEGETTKMADQENDWVPMKINYGKPHVMKSLSSQESEVSVSVSDKDDQSFEANCMEVDSASQVSSTSNATGVSAGYATATDEGQEVTASSSVSIQSSLPSTQESLDLDVVVNLERKSNQEDRGEKDGKKFDSESEKETCVVGEMEITPEYEEMEVGEGVKGGVKASDVKSQGTTSNRDVKKILQKQASEGFTPRTVISSQESQEEEENEEKMQVDDSNLTLQKLDENDERIQTISKTVDDSQVQRSLLDESATTATKSSTEFSDEKDVKFSPKKEGAEAVTPLKESNVEMVTNNKDRMMGIETATEKWGKEDQEKSVNVEEGGQCGSSPKHGLNIQASEDTNVLEERNPERDYQQASKVGKQDAANDELKVRQKGDQILDDIIVVDEEENKDDNKVCVDENPDVKNVSESGKKEDVHPTEYSGKDQTVQEKGMEVDDDVVVIPPDVSLIKSELVQNCIRGIEISAARFTSHYKSLYRLAHFYFHSKEHQNVELARDLLLGRTDWQDRKGMPAPGLFNERKGNNFFQGLWKIPIDDIDRSGSFASHVLRSVQLLVDILGSLEDLETLNHVRNQMKRTPDAGKKYLRDWDRLTLVEGTFRKMLDVMERRMGGDAAPWRWSEERREEHLGHTYCVWRWGKGSCHMQRATALLHQAFRIMMKGRTDINRLTSEQAILYCQQILPKATIQPIYSTIPSQTSHSSPVVRPPSQASNISPMDRPTDLLSSSSSSGTLARPTGQATSTSSPMARPTGQATSTSSPMARPTGHTTSSSSPMARPTGQATSTSSPMAKLTGQAISTSSPIARPTGQTTSTSSPMARPTGQTTSTSSPMVRPTDQTTSSSSPMVRPTGQTTSTSSPMARQTGQTTSTSSPMTRPTGQTTSTSSPMAKPTGQATSTISPMARQTGQTTSTSSPMTRPTGQTTSTSSPMAKPTGQATSTSSPMARQTGQTTSTSSPMTRPTGQTTSTSSPMAKPTGQATSTSCPMARQTGQATSTSSPMARQTGQTTSTSSPMTRPTGQATSMNKDPNFVNLTGETRNVDKKSHDVQRQGNTSSYSSALSLSSSSSLTVTSTTSSSSSPSSSFIKCQGTISSLPIQLEQPPIAKGAGAESEKSHVNLTSDRIMKSGVDRTSSVHQIDDKNRTNLKQRDQDLVASATEHNSGMQQLAKKVVKDVKERTPTAGMLDRGIEGQKGKSWDNAYLEYLHRVSQASERRKTQEEGKKRKVEEKQDEIKKKQDEIKKNKRRGEGEAMRVVEEKRKEGGNVNDSDDDVIVISDAE